MPEPTAKPTRRKTFIIALLTILVCMILGVEGAISSSDLDKICNQNYMVLYRFNGHWVCGQLPQPQVYSSSNLIFNGTLNGTAGFLPQWQNSSTLNNSNLYQRNQLLGVNTSQPNFTLSVVGNMSFGNSQLNVSKDGLWWPDGSFQKTSPTNTALAGTQVLLFDNDTEVSVTGNGQCYQYQIPANTYSQILVDTRGVINSLPTSSLNLTVFYNNNLVESNGVSNTLISGALTIPITLMYSQNQTSSVLLEVNATNASGSPVLRCKSFYVYGIV